MVKERGGVDFLGVVEFIYNLIKHFPQNAADYIWFFSRILERDKVGLKEKFWALFEESYSSFIRHRLTKEVLSHWNIDYNRKELIDLYSKYILNGHVDPYCRMSLYLVFLIHLDNKDQLRQSITNKIRKDESDLVKRFIVFELILISRDYRVQNIPEEKKLYNEFLNQYDAKEMALKLKLNLS